MEMYGNGAAEALANMTRLWSQIHLMSRVAVASYVEEPGTLRLDGFVLRIEVRPQKQLAVELWVSDFP